MKPPESARGPEPIRDTWQASGVVYALRRYFTQRDSRQNVPLPRAADSAASLKAVRNTSSRVTSISCRPRVVEFGPQLPLASTESPA